MKVASLSDDAATLIRIASNAACKAGGTRSRTNGELSSDGYRPSSTNKKMETIKYRERAQNIFDLVCCTFIAYILS